MPTYEYRCNACKREFEVEQRMVDDDLVKCEVCGKDALEKLISRTAFQFKGGGWYKDLYSSTKPESAASGDKAATPSSDAPAASTPAATTPAATPSTGSSGSSSGGSSSGGSSSGGSSSGSGGSSGSTTSAAS